MTVIEWLSTFITRAKYVDLTPSKEEAKFSYKENEVAKINSAVKNALFTAFPESCNVIPLKTSTVVTPQSFLKEINTKEDSLDPPKDPSQIPHQLELNKDEPSLLRTVTEGIITIPKYLLWMLPSNLVNGSSNLITPSETESKKKQNPITSNETIITREEVASEHETKISQETRIPIGLSNESGDDCFLNSVRQFVYSTDIGHHIIPNLPHDRYPHTLKDYENYQAQDRNFVMGGSRQVRDELMPAVLRNGQQDAQEALMQLLCFIDGKKNPLFNCIESTRTYDLSSLPHGLNYDRFTPDSKKDFYIIGNNQRAIHGVNVCYDLVGAIPLSIKPEGKPTLKSLQEIWDHNMNPQILREVPTCHIDEYGAYLDKSANITKEALESGRVIANRQGNYKVLPDKVGESFRFVDAPKHLIFSLKRYTNTRFGSSKINDPIDIDETFKLDHNHIKDGKAADYRIKAFICHSGDVSYGHYITYIWKEGQWYKCNDNCVGKISQDKAREAMKYAYTFYAERIGSVSKSRERVLASRAPKKDPSPSSLRSVSSDYKIKKPPIGIPLSQDAFKGTILVGEANQDDLKDGQNSSSAQALGFLAKILNGLAVTQDKLKPLLEENNAKFQQFLEKKQAKVAAISTSHQLEVAQHRVINLVVSKIEELVNDYAIYKSHGASKTHLTQYIINLIKEIIRKYKRFYTGGERSVLEQQLNSLINKRLKEKITAKALAAQITDSVLKDATINKEFMKNARDYYGSEFIDKTTTISSVYPIFKDAFGNVNFPAVETITLDAETEMRTATLRSHLSQLKEIYLDSRSEKAVGTVLTCNGSIHSVALIKQQDGSIQYHIFDSCGKKELTGNDKAFIFQTDNELEAAQFLTKLIPFQEEPRIEDQNLLGCYILLPLSEKSTSETFISRLYSISSYTLSGIYTIGSLPYRAAYCFAKSITGPCRRRKTSSPLKNVTELKEGDVSERTLGIELARLRSKVTHFQNALRDFTESDLDHLQDALFKIQPKLKPYPNLLNSSKTLLQDLAELRRRISATTTSHSVGTLKNLFPAC